MDPAYRETFPHGAAICPFRTLIPVAQLNRMSSEREYRRTNIFKADTFLGRGTLKCSHISETTSLEPRSQKGTLASIFSEFIRFEVRTMGFESWFLWFIQETEEKDDGFDEWEPLEKLTLNKFAQSVITWQGMWEIPQWKTEILKIVVAEVTSIPSLENPRVLLDKALTDCGELAWKQLY